MIRKLKPKAYFASLLISFFIVSMLPLLAAGVSFYASSLNILIKSNAQRGRDAAEVAASSIAEHLEKCRHTAYSVSKQQIVADAFMTPSEQKDSLWLKKLYRTLYSEISDNLYELSIHVISDDGKLGYSTHELPPRYNLSDYGNFEGIFSEKRPDSDRTYLYLDPFLSEKGERVACSFLRKIEGGYIIVDVLAAPLIAAAEQPIFSSMLLADTNLLHAVDFLHPEKDGTFDHFEELELLSSVKRGDMANEDPLLKDGRIIVTSRVEGSPLIFVGVMRTDQYMHAVRALWNTGIWIFAAMILLVVLIAYLISRSISVPVHNLASAMEKIEEGIPPAVPEPNRDDEIGRLTRSYNRMVRRLNELIDNAREEERALRTAERKALEAQINPHFLYNTLGTIKSIAKLNDVPEIVSISTGLGKIFRSAIGEGDGFVRLSESLEVLNCYVDIQRHRFGDRLEVVFDVPSRFLSRKIPRLLLQPLLENSFIHALDTSTEPLEIRLSAEDAFGGMLIRISDNGPGIAPADLSRISAGGGGIGISNARRRMELLYQRKGYLKIESPADGGTTVILFFPEEL